MRRVERHQHQRACCDENIEQGKESKGCSNRGRERLEGNG